jgi:hypothetical protein
VNQRGAAFKLRTFCCFTQLAGRQIPSKPIISAQRAAEGGKNRSDYEVVKVFRLNHLLAFFQLLTSATVRQRSWQIM